jgi:hypothetical protein
MGISWKRGERIIAGHAITPAKQDALWGSLGIIS